MHSRLPRGLTEHSENLSEHYSERLLRLSRYGGDGFAGGCDSNRPSPPQALLDALCLEAQVERPALVIDLGSGTGLSARAWADQAGAVVGVEASREMREQAEAATSAGTSTSFAPTRRTGLLDGAADIVTCSQSFHWMESEPTLAEAARLLRPGGVFAAYDYDWPPVVHWEVEAAFEEMLRQVGRRRGGPRGTKEGTSTESARAAGSAMRGSSCSTRASAAAPTASWAWPSASVRWS